MDFSKLSSEQQFFCNMALDGHNVRVEACIGSGKTTAIQALCDMFPKNKLILYLTYNKLLKVDAKSKIKNSNVIVTNYHGFVYPYLMRNNIRCSISDAIRTFTEHKLSIPRFDIMIIDEYQDIELDFADMLEYIKSTNPNMQIIMVGDMAQKIYDKTTLDVASWSEEFLGKHVELEFTQCFRLQHDLAAKLGRIWGKTINGVNQDCVVRELGKSSIVSYLKDKDPKDILCLGAKTGMMAAVLNELEEKYPCSFNKQTVYASISNGDANVEPNDMTAIFTTFDSSKGMEKPICVVFDWDEAYWEVRSRQPGTDGTILRNIFCVAASRGKKEIIFVKSIKNHKSVPLLSEKTLMSATEKKELTEAYTHNMFEFKYVESIATCYDMLDITKIDTVETNIEINDRDALIDLSPCIKEYQKAVFFKNYNIDQRLEYAFNQRERKMPDVSNLTNEQKLLQLVSLQTMQNRYYNQVKLPIVTPYQHNQLIDRLSERLSCDEKSQIQKAMSLNGITIHGLCDALRDNEVWITEYKSALTPENFLEAATDSILFNRNYCMLWNVKTNELYKISVRENLKSDFLTQVYKTITKKTDKAIVQKQPEKTSKYNYGVGECVTHKKFGHGCITGMRSSKNGNILIIDFDEYGVKTLNEDYVMPYA